MVKTLAEGGAHRVYIVGRRRERLKRPQVDLPSKTWLPQARLKSSR